MPPGDRKNPYLKRAAHKAKQPISYHVSPGREKKAAKRFGGWRTPGSGNKTKKGDVQITDVARIEHKGTIHKSFSITREMLGKIHNAAVASNEVPAIIVEFYNKDGKTEEEVAVIPVWALEALLKNDKTS